MSEKQERAIRATALEIARTWERGGAVSVEDYEVVVACYLDSEAECDRLREELRSVLSWLPKNSSGAEKIRAALNDTKGASNDE